MYLNMIKGINMTLIVSYLLHFIMFYYIRGELNMIHMKGIKYDTYNVIKHDQIEYN